MSYPTVKSDPYKKGVLARRRRTLWPPEFWKRLCKSAVEGGESAPFRDEVLRLISEMNLEMYGRA